MGRSRSAQLETPGLPDEIVAKRMAPRFADETKPRRLKAVLAHVLDGDGHDPGEATRRGHDLGTPAMRIPSKMGSSWARYVGSSLLSVRVARAWERT